MAWPLKTLGIATIGTAALIALVAALTTGPTDMPGSDGAVPGAGTFGPGIVRTLMENRGLTERALEGDADAAARLAALGADLRGLRIKAEEGDVEAARALHGALSLAGYPLQATEVLRIPAVRADINIQRVLSSSLSATILGDIRNCRGVDRQVLGELVALWESLRAKGDTIAEMYLQRFDQVADPNSPSDIMKTLFQRDDPVCEHRDPEPTP